MERRDAIARRAVRRRYELARLGVGVRAAWPVAVVLPLAAMIHGHVGALMLAGGVALAVAAIGFGWRGGAWLRGVGAGFLAGIPTLIVPAVVLALASTRDGAHCAGCEASASVQALCVASCLVSALVVGAAVGLRAGRDASPLRYAGAAVTVAALCGLLGCSATGLGGAVGILGGLALGGVPALLWAPRARA